MLKTKSYLVKAFIHVIRLHPWLRSFWIFKSSNNWNSLEGNVQSVRNEDVTGQLNVLDIAKRALSAEAAAVQNLSERIGSDFMAAVDLILACKGRLVVCGMGKSGLIGKKFTATFASTGTPSFFLHPGEAFHGDLGMLKPSDIVLLISYSGETEEVIRLIPILKAFGNKIISMAGDRESTLASNSDVFLDISVDREICPNNLAPTTSTLATMAMGDALSVALMEAKDFQPQDFARFHPGGSLGKKLLTKVSDVMKTHLPKVEPETSVRESLFTMTVGRMGLVLVMEGDELKGIVTDGDLRRAMLKKSDMLDDSVSSVMTTTPIIVDADVSWADAEDLMHQNKVKVLVVTSREACKVIGVAEIFD